MTRDPSSPHHQIIAETRPGCFQLTGTLDLATLMEFRQQIDEQVPFAQNIRFDLSVLDVRGSGVLALLTYCLRRASIEGGTVTIENPPERLRKIAELADIQGILGLQP